ncbi:MAG: biotin--[acetyl-CoA-carboxylase] ligase [Chitinophagaceae bacterium]|nr:biotin--[acetyl-CoA-carboxylase] ligase [Chitinophagaceae bacterium]
MQDKPIIGPLGQPFIELQSIDSTNNYALACIRNGTAGHGTTFFAHDQTAGKGQRGRKWEAEKGTNIAVSIVLQPKPLLISEQFQVSACFAVAVRKFFSRYAGTDTKIKWPNDLYWQDRKAGGILIENIISGRQESHDPESGNHGMSDTHDFLSGWKWTVAGIGININQTQFSDDLPNPVSLKQITGKDFSALHLTKELCSIANDYFSQLIHEGFEPIYKEYNNSLYKLNETVKLKKASHIFHTMIRGVSTKGQLITCHNNKEEVFDFGEVSWVMP